MRFWYFPGESGATQSASCVDSLLLRLRSKSNLNLPTIVDLVIYGLLSVGRNLHHKLNRLAVALLKRIRILHDIPARPAIQVLHDTHLDRLGLVIPHFDLKRFINPPSVIIGPVFRPAALSGHVECAAGIQPDGLVLRRMVHVVLAGELQLPIVVPPVETHSPFRQRHAQMIRSAVLELLHHPHFWIGERSVTLLLADVLVRPIPVVLVNLESVVDIDRLRLNPCSTNKLYLLGFTVVKSCGMLQCVQVIFIKGLLLDGWTKLPNRY